MAGSFAKNLKRRPDCFQRLPQPEKTADISRRHHWSPREMESEKRAQISTRGTSINQTHYPCQIWVVTRHQYGISVLVSQTSFRGETSCGVAKCRLFSQAKIKTESKKKELKGKTETSFLGRVSAALTVKTSFLGVADQLADPQTIYSSLFFV